MDGMWEAEPGGHFGQAIGAWISMYVLSPERGHIVQSAIILPS
jgi:hypothetical protein